MKIYVSSCEKILLDKLSKFEIVDSMTDASIVLIVPGGLRAYRDLFKAIDEDKKIYLYNKDFYYTPIIKNLFDLYLKGIVEKTPSEYINIECELEKIIEKMKEI